MGWAIAIGVFLFWFIFLRRGSGKPPAVDGIPGRGILLVVAPTATRMIVGGQRYERRQMRIDVEVPGEAPYEVSGDTLYPANLSGDMLPGATVEVRVDRKNLAKIAIVGPGVGFAAAGLLAAAPAASAPSLPAGQAQGQGPAQGQAQGQSQR